MESKQEFLKRYPSGKENLRLLEETPNARVIFNIDATQINTSCSGKYTDIFMNFPHHGGKTNLRKSRELLSKIFKSVSEVMNGDQCRFRLSLARGQSGLNYEDVKKDGPMIKEIPKHNSDSWQAIYLAAEYDLITESAHEFMLEKFSGFPNYYSKQLLGYQSSGYLNRDRGFHNKCEADTLVFIKSPPIKNQLNDRIKLEDGGKICELASKGKFCGDRKFHAFRPFFAHDISVLLKRLDFDEEHIYPLIGVLAGNLIVRIIELEHMRSVCPKTNLPNYIYRLYWQTVKSPLTKKKCNALQEQLRDKLTSAFKNWPFILT